MLSNTLSLDLKIIWKLFTFLIYFIVENKQKNKCVYIHEIIWLITYEENEDENEK